MKHHPKFITPRTRIMILLASTFFFVLLANGFDKSNQSQQPTPEKVAMIYYVEPADHSLRALEECSGDFVGSGNGSTVISFLACKGAKASFRLKTNAKLEFVVRLASADSKKKYLLYPVLIKGDLRALNMSQSARTPMRPAIPTNVVKSGDLVTIKPLRALAGGEYIFVSFSEIVGMRTVIPGDAFNFGLDAP